MSVPFFPPSTLCPAVFLPLYVFLWLALGALGLQVFKSMSYGTLKSVLPTGSESRKDYICLPIGYNWHLSSCLTVTVHYRSNAQNKQVQMKCRPTTFKGVAWIVTEETEVAERFCFLEDMEGKMLFDNQKIALVETILIWPDQSFSLMNQAFFRQYLKKREYMHVNMVLHNDKILIWKGGGCVIIEVQADF